MLALDLRSKSFGDTPVLKDIALTLAQGERIAILGPSGIGKSTLLRIIAGLDTQFEGTRAAPERISLMFQSPNLLAWRSVADNLAVFHPQASDADIRGALAQVGLIDKADLFPRQLSVGQQRRLALARSFMGAADLILLDEPFTSLDQELRADMIALTQRLLAQSNSSLILVTHAPEEAEMLGASPLQLTPHAMGAHFVQT